LPLLNRAQARDFIRREIGITPPIDTGTGNAGDAPANRPDPTNAILNQCIWTSIEQVNRRIGFAETTSIQYPVAAQTTLGPTSIPLQNILSASSNLINDVRRAAWNGGVGDVQVLEAWTSDDMDKSGYQYDNMGPAVPQRFWVRAYTLFLSPAPASAGTLNLYAGMGVLPPISDSDYIQQLPESYQDIVWRGAAVKWLETCTQDSEAQARLQAIAPLFYQQGLDELMTWKMGVNKPQTFSFGYRSYRRGPGLRSNKS
jgi:hypothetical protein